MSQLDPRLYAYREDLAAASLQDRVHAPRYAEGELRQVAAPAAPIRIAPRFDAPLATEALSGELLTAYEFRDGWAWVQLHDDGYVGYTPVDCLSGVIEENTHRVSARLTYLYPAPDLKRPPVTKLSFFCSVAPIGGVEGRFVEVLRGGFVFSDHLVSVRERAMDYVRVAERFAGVPYLWGGKTSLGIDCSGLVQISLRAAGIPCLRDSDMQMQSVGEPLDPSNLDAVQRGDLLFWQGHVAIVHSQDWMVHASGHHMEVVVEPLRRAIERIAETHGPIVAILRPPTPLQQQPPAQPRATAEQKPAIAVQKPAPGEPAAAINTPPQERAGPPASAQSAAPPQPQRPAIATAAQKGPQPAPAPAQPQNSAPANANMPGVLQPGAGPAASAKPAAAQPRRPEPPGAPPSAAAFAAKAGAVAGQSQKQASPGPANARPPGAPLPGPTPASEKEQAQIDAAAKTVAAQIQASLAAAQRGRSDSSN